MQPRRPRDHKLTPDSELPGQQAVNLIERVVLDMRFLLQPRGPFDPGIDGRIELRDARTKQPLARSSTLAFSVPSTVGYFQNCHFG